MSVAGYAFFETATGSCGIAWRERGIVGVQLPEATSERSRLRMETRFPDLRESTPPPHVADAIRRVTALLRGEDVDLAPIALDMTDVPAFQRGVYEIARAIPRGTTMTYGEIAARLGDPGAARAVGRALGHNPFAPVVPCHRVLAADGTMHGFSATGGVAMKLRMLTTEGWEPQGGPTLFDAAAAT